MNSTIYFLASRYLLAKRENSINSMIAISFFAVFIGSFSLALVTSIMNGFEQAVHEKMQNIHPQATMYSYSGPIHYPAVKKMLQDEFSQVIAQSPQAIGHVLLQPDESDQSPIVAMIKGIDPVEEKKVSALETKMHKKKRLERAVANGKIAIGKELAKQLNVKINEKITLFYLEPPEQKAKKVFIDQHEVIIGGIFDTGIDEYDAGVVISNLETFAKLFPESGISQVALSFKKNTDIEKTISAIQKRSCLEVHSWQELYPALVSALKLEKYAMFFILLLITLVASMNIIALVFMFITYKKTDVAILLSMGMRLPEVQQLFTLISVIIAFFGCIFGLVCAWLASYALENYPFIELPDAYYVSHLPACMTMTITAIVFALVLTITFFASWFASKRIKGLNVSEILRFEG